MYEMKRCWMGIVTVMLLVATAHASEMLTPGNQSLRPIANAKKMEPQKLSTPLPAQPIELNNASRAQLETLPGIGPAESARIVAGRPYGSKAWLVTNKILDPDAYSNIKQLIVAGQPSKDAGKNAAIYQKK